MAMSYMFPNALTTGVRGGTAGMASQPNGGSSINGSVSNLAFTTGITVSASGTASNPLVISHCYFTGGTLQLNGNFITVQDCYFVATATNANLVNNYGNNLVQYCEMAGEPAGANQTGDCCYANGNSASAPATFSHCNMHGFSKMVYVTGSGNVTVDNCYMWYIISYGEHSEQIFINGSGSTSTAMSNINITNNNMPGNVNWPGGSGGAATGSFLSGELFVSAGSSGTWPVNNVTISGNLIIGGGHNFEFGANPPGLSGLTIDSNRAGSYSQGYQYSAISGSGTFTNNLDWLSGQLITDGGSTGPPSTINITYFDDSGGSPAACFVSNVLNSGSPYTPSATFGQQVAVSANITLHGAAPAGHGVQVFDGATSVGTTTANSSSGQWSLSFTLGSGVRSITAKDTSANVTSSAFSIQAPGAGGGATAWPDSATFAAAAALLAKASQRNLTTAALAPGAALSAIATTPPTAQTIAAAGALLASEVQINAARGRLPAAASLLSSEIQLNQALALVSAAGGLISSETYVPAAPVYSGPTNVVSIGNNSAGGNTTATISITIPTSGIPAGSQIIVAVSEFETGAAVDGSVSDSVNGNYLASLASATSGGGSTGQRVQVFSWYSAAISGTGKTITYTKHATTNYACMVAFYVTGPSDVDLSTVNVATGGGQMPSVAMGPVLDAGGELLVTVVGWTGPNTVTFTPPTDQPWTQSPITTAHVASGTGFGNNISGCWFGNSFNAVTFNSDNENVLSFSSGQGWTAITFGVYQHTPWAGGNTLQAAAALLARTTQTEAALSLLAPSGLLRLTETLMTPAIATMAAGGGLIAHETFVPATQGAILIATGGLIAAQPQLIAQAAAAIKPSGGLVSHEVTQQATTAAFKPGGALLALTASPYIGSILMPSGGLLSAETMLVTDTPTLAAAAGLLAVPGIFGPSSQISARLAAAAGILAQASVGQFVFPTVNYIKWSQNFENWGNNVNTTVTANAADPWGGHTAEFLAETATSGFHDVEQQTALPAGTYTYSIYAAPNQRTRVSVGAEDSSGNNGVYCDFDLAGDQVGVPITTYGTPGWSATNPIVTVITGGSNYVSNNTMVGASAPTTLPTNWHSEDRSLGNTANGITATVVGSGVDGNGRNYVDVNWAGTASGIYTYWGMFPAHPPDLYAGGNLNDNAAPAANGQTWTFSTWLSVVGGSTANLTNCWLQINDYDINNNYLASPGFQTVLSTVSGTSTRYSSTATIADATCAKIGCSISVSWTTGPVNITLRIAWPQLEQGSAANPPVLTSGTVVTGGNWDQISLVVTTLANPQFFCALDANTGTGAHNANYAGVAGDGVYIWGAQVSPASTIAPYYQTFAYPALGSYVPAMSGVATFTATAILSKATSGATLAAAVLVVETPVLLEQAQLVGQAAAALVSSENQIQQASAPAFAGAGGFSATVTSGFVPNAYAGFAAASAVLAKATALNAASVTVAPTGALASLGVMRAAVTATSAAGASLSTAEQMISPAVAILPSSGGLVPSENMLSLVVGSFAPAGGLISLGAMYQAGSVGAQFAAGGGLISTEQLIAGAIGTGALFAAASSLLAAESIISPAAAVLSPASAMAVGTTTALMPTSALLASAASLVSAESILSPAAAGLASAGGLVSTETAQLVSGTAILGTGGFVAAAGTMRMDLATLSGIVTFIAPVTLLIEQTAATLQPIATINANPMSFVQAAEQLAAQATLMARPGQILIGQIFVLGAVGSFVALGQVQSIEGFCTVSDWPVAIVTVSENEYV